MEYTHMFRNFVLVLQKSPPKASSGVKMKGIDAASVREADDSTRNGAQKARTGQREMRMRLYTKPPNMLN